MTLKSPRTALEPEQVPPPPPRRSRGARNPFVIVGNAIITLLLVAIIGGGALYFYGKTLAEAPGPLKEDKVVVIPQGQRMSDIGDTLVRHGVIEDNRLAFVGTVLAMKARANLKSGEYLFTKGASLREVIETIVEGKVVQHSVTVAEGLTSQQIVAKLLENDVLTGTINEIPREGTLLPETYKVVRGTSREQIIQRMQQAQRRAVKEIWERRISDLPISSPEQLITLASVVEKETGRADERSRVAAVFVNRLRRKMRLQSDPTIIYGLVGGRGTLGRPINRSEIRQPTPYNTYVIDGLPPGPIANPGRASLEAAANPARTRDLYFVADGNGGHTFTETYDAHRKNVSKLRAIEKENREVDRSDGGIDDEPADSVPDAPAASGDSKTGTATETPPAGASDTSAETPKPRPVAAPPARAASRPAQRSDVKPAPKPDARKKPAATRPAASEPAETPDDE